MSYLDNNWSYSGAPSTSNKDAIRFLIGDTNSEAKLVSDSEIRFADQLGGNVYSAASMVALSIAATFSPFVDYTVGEVSESGSQRAAHFIALSKALNSMAYNQGAVSPAFGTSTTQPSVFTITQFDNNGGAEIDGRKESSDFNYDSIPGS